VKQPRTLLAAGKTRMEALRCLKRRISDVIYRQLVNDARVAAGTTDSVEKTQTKRVREGTAGRLKNPARSTCPRTSTLRISHFPDPQHRRYAPPAELGKPRRNALSRRALDTGAPDPRDTTLVSSRDGHDFAIEFRGRASPGRSGGG
jgi:hypothetical protein